MIMCIPTKNQNLHTDNMGVEDMDKISDEIQTRLYEINVFSKRKTLTLKS